VVKRPALSLDLEAVLSAARGIKTVDVDNGLPPGDPVSQAAVIIDTEPLRKDMEDILAACGMDMTGYSALATVNDKVAHIENALFDSPPDSNKTLSGSNLTFKGANPFVYEVSGQKKVDRYWDDAWDTAWSTPAGAAGDFMRYTNGKADRWVAYAAFVGKDTSAWSFPLAPDPAGDTPPWYLPDIAPLQRSDPGEPLATSVYGGYRKSLRGMIRILDYYRNSYTADWSNGNDDDYDIIAAALVRLESLAREFYLGVFYQAGTVIDVAPGLALE
jgi:hypothetical protein